MTFFKKKILLVEDEPNVAHGIEDYLQTKGYSILWAFNAQKALSLLHTPMLRLVILDLQLPDQHGFDFAKIIRKKHPLLPIMFLTAFHDPFMRIQGLEIGAEDFLGKPFHPKELLLRIENILKRHPVQGIFSFGAAQVDLSKLTLTREHHTHALTPKEGALIEYFISHPHQIISREDLLNALFPQNQDANPRTIDNWIVKLRKWMEPDPQHPIYIKSIRKVGYQFIPLKEKK